MAERANWAFGFPVAPHPAAQARIERVTVRIDPAKRGESSFRIEYSDPSFKVAERAVQEFRNAMRGTLTPTQCDERDQSHVNFTPHNSGPYTGNSFLMLAMAADHLTATRPELFDGLDSNGGQELAVLATGQPDGKGHLSQDAQGANVGSLEAKLRVIKEQGIDDFKDYKTRVLLVPDQVLSAAEDALIDQISDAGWDVRKVSDLGPLLATEPFTPAVTPRIPDIKAPLLTWPRIGVAAGLACALFAFGVWQGADTPLQPVDIATPFAAVVAPDIDITAPQNAAATVPDESRGFTGALSVKVQILRNGKTYPAPLGNPFLPSEVVRLVWSHAGTEPAQIVLFQGTSGVDSFTIAANQSVQRDYTLNDLLDKNGGVGIAITDCVQPDCRQALAQLVVDPVFDAENPVPVGKFDALRPQKPGVLREVLKFELM